MRIYLVGYMGAGKTTLGRQLAEKLGFDFLDLDEIIKKQEGKTITQLFQTYGEGRFREIESDCLRETARMERVIVATGGGTPCFHANMQWMLDTGLTVFVKASPLDLYNRLSKEKESRPLLRNIAEADLQNFIQSALIERSPFYELAHLFTESKGEINDQLEELASFIVRFLPVKEK